MVAMREEAGRADPRLRAGARVRVRSAEQILATLDERGELEALPFMPEMLRFCGSELTVDKVALKACDTITRGGLRRMDNAVHLTGARCDGSAHGGCQNACLLYWKTEWLEPVGDGDGAPVASDERAAQPRVTEADLQEATRKEPTPDGEERYACQATELNRATPQQLPFRALGQYVADVRSGNAGVLQVVRAFAVGLFNRVQNISTRLLPERFWFRHGRRWPFLEGRATGRTPTVQLDLQPGERVRVRSREEILETLSPDLHNRGLGFDEEMSRFCGREARVQRRVDRVIDEKTCRLVHMKTPSVVLDDVVCEGAYNANCPRKWTCFWREIWLERVDGS